MNIPFYCLISLFDIQHSFLVTTSYNKLNKNIDIEIVNLTITRKSLHRRAKRGTGGLSVLIKNKIKA